jgi:hypothetical protein
MTKEQIVEAEVEEMETNKELVAPEVGTDSGAMDAMIEVSQKVAEFEKAFATVMNFILRQSYAADWVSHARATEPIHLRSANITSAGAERIARSLGIQEKNWVRKEKIWSDDRAHYTYECTADFSLGKRTIHCMGRASSQDKFFGFANGQWKELGDVKEDDIKMAAFRNCRKEGVRALLGLRRIPLLKLQSLGFDLNLVHCVNFKNSKEAVAGQLPSSAPVAQVEQKPTEQPKDLVDAEAITISISSATAKVSKNGKPYYVIVDEEGVKYTVWGDDKSEKVSALLVAYRDHEPIQIKAKNDDYNTIEWVKANG